MNREFIEIIHTFFGSFTVFTILISLFLTLVIEILLCVPFIKKKKMSVQKLKDVILVNCLTNPVVVVIMTVVNVAFYFFDFEYIFVYYYTHFLCWFLIAILEFLVIVVEGKLFKKFLSESIKRPYLFSLYLIVLSYFIGYLFSDAIFYFSNVIFNFIF